MSLGRKLDEVISLLNKILAVVNDIEYATEK